MSDTAELAQLVLRRRLGQAARRVAGPRDLTRAGRQSRERSQGATGEPRADQSRDQRRRQGGEHEQATGLREGVVDRAGARGDEHHAAACGAAPRGERLGEHAQRRATEGDRGTCAPARERALLGFGHAQDLGAERGRARDDALVAVEHLHEQLLTAERRLQRAGLGDELRRRGDELRHLGRTCAQRPVELVVQLPSEQHHERGAEHRERDEDAQRSRQPHPHPQAAEPHSPTAKPSPRTVRMIGGSPSLRRRFVT